MLIFADHVPDDFEYPCQLEDTIVWHAREKDITNPYAVDEYDCSLIEQYEDFVQTIWETLCGQYGLNTAGMTNEVEEPVAELDEFIDGMYEPIEAFGNKYPASEVMFHMEASLYNYLANRWIGHQVYDILDEFIQTGEYHLGQWVWRRVDKTVDELIEEEDTNE